MAHRRKINRKQIAAVLDLLDRIENELPSGPLGATSEAEGEDLELEEDNFEFTESRGVEVDDIEVVIDVAILDLQKKGLLPKIKKGTYSLSAVFEIFFGEESSVVELAIDLEATLSGYEDMIWNDEVRSALEMIEEIRVRIKEETQNAAPAISN